VRGRALFTQPTQQHAAALLGLAAAAAIYLWPLLARLDSALPGTAADHDVATFAWNVSWVRHALETGSRLLFTEMVLTPYGADLRLHTLGLLQGLMAFPLTWLLGDLGAFNLVLALSVWLNGACLYALAWAETRSRWAAWVAALAFALSGPLLAQMRVGRPSVGALWLTCAALLALRALLARPNARTGALLGLVLVGALLADFQVLYFTGLWLALYALCRVWRERGRQLTGPHLAAGTLAGVMAGAPLLAVYGPALASTASAPQALPSFDDMQAYAFQLRHFFMPRVVPLYASIALLAGAAAAVVLYRWRGSYRFWLAAALVSFVFALGPYLAPTRLPLPTALAGTLWPPLRHFRTPGRMTMPAQIGLALAAAYALARVRPRLRGRWAPLGAAAAAAVVILGEALWRHPFPVQVYPRYAAYRSIAAEPGAFALLEVPVGVRSGLDRIGTGGEILQFYQGQHGKRLINGMVARLPASVFEGYRAHCSLLFLSGEMSATLGCDLAGDLRAVLDWIGARYVLVHQSLLEPGAAREIRAFLDSHPSLAPPEQEQDLLIYRVEP
jgi:hypothetical protein